MIKPIKRKRTKTIEKLKLKQLRAKAKMMEKFLSEHFDSVMNIIESRNGYDIVNRQEKQNKGE